MFGHLIGGDVASADGPVILRQVMSVISTSITYTVKRNVRYRVIRLDGRNAVEEIVWMTLRLEARVTGD